MYQKLKSFGYSDHEINAALVASYEQVCLSQTKNKKTKTNVHKSKHKNWLLIIFVHNNKINNKIIK